MLTEHQKNACKRIIESLGLFSQRSKAVEELGELTIELQKVIITVSRTMSYPDRFEKDALITEIGDVFVTLTQIVQAYGIECEVRDEIQHKLDRILDRIASDQTRRVLIEKGIGMHQDTHLIAGGE